MTHNSLSTLFFRITFLLSWILLAGCASKPAYFETYKFENGIWNRFKFLNYEFQISKPENSYNLSAIITFNEFTNIEMLPVNVVMTLPGGEERIKDYNLFLKDRDGVFKGEKKEGNYELKVVLRENFQFPEKGLVKIEIENLNPKIETPGILSFGIMVEKYKE